MFIRVHSWPKFVCLFLIVPLLLAQNVDPRDQDYWNGKFSDPKTAFNRSPNQMLVEAIRERKPGLAVDLGMGEGRNAVYLAQQGWQVTGVDQSDVAVGQAKKRALEAGVKLDAVVDDLDHFDLGRGKWDLVVLMYVHAWYRGAKPRSVQRIVEALKPGGLVVIEGFAGDETYMFHSNELLRDFGSEFKILRYEDLEAQADWAPGRKSHIIRLVGEKSR
ncbi:MAG TPA: class I SAM-dependent methyltransferase [Bryobacteraceae bacterium]|nr:class I SAM-dependent methyltransferase [Bryobacteraceae bacterium]